MIAVPFPQRAHLNCTNEKQFIRNLVGNLYLPWIESELYPGIALRQTPRILLLQQCLNLRMFGPIVRVLTTEIRYL